VVKLSGNRQDLRKTQVPKAHISGSAQKLCFEYEHFMFHQRTTVDRIAFFLSGFDKQRNKAPVKK
jgi:hypothetical protein